MDQKDLELIRHDAAAIATVQAALADDFYTTLFELAPDIRPLFPDDMTAQQQKFSDEIVALVTLAASIAAGDLDEFNNRARDLGRTHDDYHATAAHYDLVGVALLAALERHLPTWDDTHRSAWSRIYRVTASAMQQP